MYKAELNLNSIFFSLVFFSISSSSLGVVQFNSDAFFLVMFSLIPFFFSQLLPCSYVSSSFESIWEGGGKMFFFFFYCLVFLLVPRPSKKTNTDVYNTFWKRNRREKNTTSQKRLDTKQKDGLTFLYIYGNSDFFEFVRSKKQQKTTFSRGEGNFLYIEFSTPFPSYVFQ